MGGLCIPLANSHPNNEYNLGECHGDGWDHPHNYVLVEAGVRKKHMRFHVHLQHNEARPEPLAPGDSASHIRDAVREAQALAAEAAS